MACRRNWRTWRSESKYGFYLKKKIKEINFNGRPSQPPACTKCDLTLDDDASQISYSVSASKSDDLMVDCLRPVMKRTFPDVDYAFYGYNVMRGYPLTSGRDPGYTHKVTQGSCVSSYILLTCSFLKPFTAI